jgi:iron(III) transport system ATP-binding protein
MTVLSIRGVGRRFGAVTALAGLDLDLPAGSRMAVVGPSGSGKTTLLRLVAGFEIPDAGEIRLDGEKIADSTTGVPAHRRNIGLVMQEGALFPHLTVLENVRFGIRDRADAEASALKLMDLVELERSMASRQPHQLSGGQQQRVALARALARRPRLMLLDEPFSALDTGLRDQLRQSTAQILSEAGVATLLVTHDQREAMSFADQLVVLREGRLIQAGPPRELYLFPADSTTAAFLGPAVILDAELHDGVALCAIGEVSVTRARTGRARILLRPEQLELIQPSGDGTPGAGACRVLSAELVGSTARVTIELASNSRRLTFEIAPRAVPPLGSLRTVIAAGPAWVLPDSA